MHKAVERSLNDVGAGALIEAATAVLDCYDAWASTVERGATAAASGSSVRA